MTLDVRLHDEIEEHEFVVIDAGGVSIQIYERDDDVARIYVHDHATIDVEGKTKDRVEIHVAPDEFPTSIEQYSSERSFQEARRDG